MKKKSVGKTVLEFDECLFNELRKAYDLNTQPASSYWREYVQSIVNVIERDQLSGFGKDYFLTQGFGDALKTTTPRYRLRKILRFPAIYKTVEKYSAIYRYEKTKSTFFDQMKGALHNLGFARFLAERLDPSTKDLGINRYIYIEGKRVPYRYLMFLLYVEMLSQIAAAQKIPLNLDDIFDGNYMDIGGGYGCTTDGISLLKEYRSIGRNTVNYTLDQFPITFIANQFLKFRNAGNIFDPIYLGKNSEGSESGKSSTSRFRVIQNDAVKELKKLNIKFFFNANSFQEMDASQIEEYCQFININKSASAYMAAFFYDTNKELSTPKMPLNILKNNFSMIGSMHIKELFGNSEHNIPHGVIKGFMCLFRLDEGHMP